MRSYRTFTEVKLDDIISTYRCLLTNLRTRIGKESEFGTPVTQKLIDTIEKRYDEITNRKGRRRNHKYRNR